MNLHDKKDKGDHSNNKLKPSTNLDELMNLYDALLVRNAKVTKCIICDSDIQVNQGVVLKNCFHLMCDECLIGTVNGALDENVEVRCPMILDDDQRCAYFI